jgi:lysozyme
MRVSQALVDDLKRLEGCRLTAYLDRAGVWTIGYGHTKGVKEGDVITQARAEQIYFEDLDFFAPEVEKLIKRPVNQNQFDALVCLAFNIGTGPKGLGGSELLKRFNLNDVEGAAEQFARWIHVRGPQVELAIGTTGEAVSEWQSFLKSEGLTVKVDGSYGPKTAEVTRAWQKQHGKAEDGIGRIRIKVIDVGLVRRRVWEIVRFLRA